MFNLNVYSINFTRYITVKNASEQKNDSLSERFLSGMWSRNSVKLSLEDESAVTRSYVGSRNSSMKIVTRSVGNTVVVHTVQGNFTRESWVNEHT